MNPQKIPHMAVVVAASAIAVFGYAVFSGWVVGWFNDPALRGDILGTWKSFAVLAFGFWLGSSSGGKMREEKGKDDPQSVTVVNKASDPVPTTTEPLPDPDFTRYPPEGAADAVAEQTEGK